MGQEDPRIARTLRLSPNTLLALTVKSPTINKLHRLSCSRPLVVFSDDF